MRRNHPLFRHGQLAASLCAFMAASVLASTSVGPDEPGDMPVPPVMADNDTLRIEATAPLAPAAQPVVRQSQRVIQITGSNREVHLWNQRALDGSQTSHYAIMERRAGDAAASIVGRERQTSYDIGLRYASFDPRIATPGVNAQLLAPANNELFLVQFWAVPLDEMRAEIEAMGGKIYRFLEDHTHIVRMPAGIADNVRRLNFVRWVGPFHPAYKLDELILSRFAGGFSPEAGVKRYIIEVFERDITPMPVREEVAADDIGAAPVRIRGVQGTGQLMSIMALIDQMGAGAVVHNARPSQFWVEASLTDAQMLQLALRNEVHWIEPWRGPMEMDMNLVRQLGGANALQAATNMSGQGVRGEVFDTELRTSHQEFTTITPVVLSPGTTGTFHGTSVFSVVFARGASANARGLLPNAAEGYFYRGSDSTYFGGNHQSRLQIAQTATNATNQCVFQTSSLGQARTLVYTVHSSEMDDVVFLTGLIHCQSQSNAGCCANPRASRPAAWSKNTISGGAVNHFNSAGRADDTWKNGTTCSFPSCGGSIGPAADGRIKPDLSFFFDQTLAARGSSNTAYTQFGGTSGATPSIAGYIGLFHQMWHENTWEGSGRLTGGSGSVFSNRPNSTLPKAALINSAFRYNWNSGGANASLNRNVQGWGMPNVDTIYDLRNKTYYADEPFLLRQGNSKTHTIVVAAGEPNLNVTMAYLDPMGTTSATTHRINDLSLRVTSPSGTSYWGNNGLTADNTSSSGGSSNTKDTVENVFIPNPAAGAWTVEVMADVVVQDSHVETAALDTDYALWVTGGTESTSIKTTFRAGNGHDGVMFDFTAHENIEITGFEIAHPTFTNFTVEVWWTPNTYVGKENNPVPWTLLGSDTVAGLGIGAATGVSVGGLQLSAGETVGLYVTETGVAAGSMAYTNGSETWDNGEVAISAGVGKEYPWAGTFNPRSFNGVVYYDVLPPSGVGPYAFSIQSNGDDQLYRIDLITGSTQSMGAAMRFGDAEGMTMMPNGTLLAIGGTVDELWNVTSPPGSLIGNTGTRDGLDAGLDWSEIGRALYNLQGGVGSTLYRINPNNGASALIGTSRIYADNIAIDKNANAYAIDGGTTASLYSVNLTNGSLTLIGSLGLGSISVQFGTAFLGDTLYALDWNGKIYTINTSTGAATLRTTVAAGGWEGLAIPCSAARFMPTANFNNTFSGNSTRGYWFEAPTDFLITGLRVPDEAGKGIQNVEVMRFNVAIPSFPGVTNNFTSLFRAVDVANNNVIHTSIPVGEGDIIGILGAAGTATMRNSYGPNTAGVPIEIFGQASTAIRMGMQFNLNTTQAKDIFTENPGPIARVEMYYTDVPDVFLDADSVATGSTLDTTPLVTTLGTITATGTVEINSITDPELSLAGSGGNVFDIINIPTSEASMTFDFDVDSLTFVYGGNSGGITVTALDAANAVVDEFTQASTAGGEPAGPQTLAGSGIRRLVWSDPGNSFAPLDNIKILGQPACPCACNFDTSTGIGVCDLIDFVTFAGQFAGGCL